MCVCVCVCVCVIDCKNLGVWASLLQERTTYVPYQHHPSLRMARRLSHAHTRYTAVTPQRLHSVRGLSHTPASRIYQGHSVSLGHPPVQTHDGCNKFLRLLHPTPTYAPNGHERLGNTTTANGRRPVARKCHRTTLVDCFQKMGLQR